MIPSGLVDTHCHIDAYDNPLAVLDEASAAGVHVVAVTEDPGRYRLLRTRLGRRAGIDIALGYHPLRAGALAPHDLARFFRLLPQTRWVGEIGLDFSRTGASTRFQQLRVFEAILAEPQLRARPVTVHSRGAEREVISRLAQAQQPAILHWYTGPLGAVDDALAAGLSFSINPAMIKSKKVADLLERLPRDRVLLETDGPYAKHAGRPARPADLTGVLHRLSALWQTSEDQAMARVLTNQQRLFT
ncbi:MAG TPA: TatD family hydrolase [Amycolatopsis sp.]|uniref:TatD family hydrolase n=1 Tax=Amycolatopsis sp. TaxID=37632 RepID=UPI002B49A338|nr:TatD family hydrolase [Amycolatopsis sp.]HKS47107.1 TatD family hydrolase [Amycolatopsis sp.]